MSQTERQAALKLVPTHPGPSPAVLHVCVMSGRLIQPCHQKPYHCWTGFSAPPRCQRRSVPTLKIPWHVFWHLINVSPERWSSDKNQQTLFGCLSDASVLVPHKQRENECLNVFSTMTEMRIFLHLKGNIDFNTAACSSWRRIAITWAIIWKHSLMDRALSASFTHYVKHWRA